MYCYVDAVTYCGDMTGHTHDYTVRNGYITIKFYLWFSIKNIYLATSMETDLDRNVRKGNELFIFRRRRPQELAEFLNGLMRNQNATKEKLPYHFSVWAYIFVSLPLLFLLVCHVRWTPVHALLFCCPIRLVIFIRCIISLIQADFKSWTETRGLFIKNTNSFLKKSHKL